MWVDGKLGWTPTRLATHCPSGQPFSVSHAFSCPKGAMPSIRHNAIRDTTAQLLTEVCPNVCVEPTLQPLTGESFPLRSTNTEEGARLDIKAQNFWDKSKQINLFDVRIFNSHAPANCSSSTDACYRRHEHEKRRAYEQCVLKVEHGTFTPLVLSTSGGWGLSATVAFKRLAGLISEKYDKPYSSTLSFIRRKIAFSLIDSAISCLRAPQIRFSCSSQGFQLDGLPLGPHPCWGPAWGDSNGCRACCDLSWFVQVLYGRRIRKDWQTCHSGFVLDLKGSFAFT